MSNGSLTCTINEIWRIAISSGSVGALADTLFQLAQDEDCDMHNLEPGLVSLARRRMRLREKKRIARDVVVGYPAKTIEVGGENTTVGYPAGKAVVVNNDTLGYPAQPSPLQPQGLREPLWFLRSCMHPRPWNTDGTVYHTGKEKWRKMPCYRLGRLTRSPS